MAGRWKEKQRCVHVSHRTVAYADDFVTQRKGIASLDRFDCVQFKMNFVFFTLNYTFRFFPYSCKSPPPHRGACIAFFSVFINENMQHWSGSIIQVQCQKTPWYPFQTIVQCVSKLTERDVYVLSNTKPHDEVWPLSALSAQVPSGL